MFASGFQPAIVPSGIMRHPQQSFRQNGAVLIGNRLASDAYMSSLRFGVKDHVGDAAQVTGNRRQDLNNIRDRLCNEPPLPITQSQINLIQHEVLSLSDELADKAIQCMGLALWQNYDVVVSAEGLERIYGNIRGESTTDYGDDRASVNKGVKTLERAMAKNKVPKESPEQPLPKDIEETLFENIKPSHDAATRTTAFEALSAGIRHGYILKLPTEVKNSMVHGIISGQDDGTKKSAFFVFQNGVNRGLIMIIPPVIQQNLFPALFRILNSSQDEILKSYIHSNMASIAEKRMITNEGIKIIYTELQNPDASWDTLRTAMRVIGNAYRVNSISGQDPTEAIQKKISSYKNSDDTALKGSARGARNVLRQKRLWTIKD